MSPCPAHGSFRLVTNDVGTQVTGCISCASGDGGPIWYDTNFEADPDENKATSAAAAT